MRLLFPGIVNIYLIISANVVAVNATEGGACLNDEADVRSLAVLFNCTVKYRL